MKASKLYYTISVMHRNQVHYMYDAAPTLTECESIAEHYGHSLADGDRVSIYREADNGYSRIIAHYVRENGEFFKMQMN